MYWMRIVVVAFVLLLTRCAHGQSETILDLRQGAYQVIVQQNWDEAAEQYSKLTELSPTDGALWNNLGLALLQLDRTDEALTAYSHALGCGWRPQDTYYNMACVNARAGRTAAAIDAMARAYAVGFINDELLTGDSDLRSLHENTQFRKIVGWPIASVTSRYDHWSADLDFLERRIREVHWCPFHDISESEFNSRIDAIRRSIDSSDDGQMRMQIQSLLAALGDGHTSVIPDFFFMLHGGGNVDVQFLPVELFWFNDGVRIIATSEEYKRLMGARIVSIGGLGIDDVIARADPYVSRDNEWGARWGLMLAIGNPRMLSGLGLGDVETGFVFEVEALDGQVETVQLPTGDREALNRLRPDEVFDVNAPLSCREKDQHLWMQPAGAALYVRIDGIHDGHPETFAEFTDRIFTTAERNDSKALIVDLRDNLGGQGHLTQPLLHRLIASERFNRDRALFVIVGRKTFSAAMAFAAQVELHTAARFVGEPTGSRPNFVGESSLIRLPYSGIMISVSSRYHQNGASDDQRLWIAPDIPIVPSFDDLREGWDRAIESVLESVGS